MRYESAAAFRMALEQRMRTEAERTGFHLARLRKRVAFELFLRRAQHLAEKVHAYTGSYGTTARPSTRPKDLVDILLIADSQSLEAAAVREALKHTFETRARQALPEHLPAPPPEWAPDYGRLAEEVGLEPDLAAAFERAAAFLDPVLATGVGRRSDSVLVGAR